MIAQCTNTKSGKKEDFMRSTLFALTSVLLLSMNTLAVAADAPAVPPPVQVVVGTLGLSDEQVQAWMPILQAREAAMQPLAAQVAQHRELLGRLLQSPTPDPASVGQVLIETRVLEQQVAAIQQQATAQFEQLLNPDQQQRLDSIRQAAQVCPVVPAYQAVGLL
jgi:uncharacterized membrane protein